MSHWRSSLTIARLRFNSRTLTIKRHTRKAAIADAASPPPTMSIQAPPSLLQSGPRGPCRLKPVIAACYLALHAGAACADDKIYLICLTPERFPGNLSIDLKAGIVSGDWESKITRATETSIEFEGKDPDRAPPSGETWKGIIDRLSGRLFVEEDMAELDDNGRWKRVSSFFTYQCDQVPRPKF
jgi:hypothetical protein